MKTATATPIGAVVILWLIARSLDTTAQGAVLYIILGIALFALCIGPTVFLLRNLEYLDN